MAIATPVVQLSRIAILGVVVAALGAICALVIPGPLSPVFGGLGAIIAIGSGTIALANRTASRKTRNLALSAIALGTIVLVVFTVQLAIMLADSRLVMH